MIRSMTGFGRGRAESNDLSFSVEIKTVNHKYLDIYVRLPKHLTFVEEKIKKEVSKTISRGKVEIYISYEDSKEDSKVVVVDKSLANAYIKAINDLKNTYELKDDISVSLITKLPEVLKVEKEEYEEEQIWDVLSKATKEALENLVSMRTAEGEELKKDLKAKIFNLENILAQIEKYSSHIVEEYKHKLENRLKELLEQQVIDENRIAIEVAIFADKCSIDEEIIRLRSHFHLFKNTLNENIPIGRKLDFIIQEMNREINTIGSKANNINISKNVVEVKSEIEKLREQVQNIE